MNEIKDVYSRITARIIADLEQGVRPWMKPWSSEHAAGRITRPLRHNGVPYQGINVVMLWSAAAAKGYSCPLWLTFKQALELGGNVRKGETGELVVYANRITRTETDDKGEELEREIPFLKGYTVFNAEQCDGLPALYTAPAEAPAPSPLDRITHADQFFANTGADERTAFLRQAELADRQVRTLCMTLAYAGCRLSEALALTADRVDLSAGVLTIESLKKRRTGVFRTVPVPPALLETLDMVHGIREQQAARGKGRGVRLWPWSRMTGWRAVHAIMEAARLDGPHASPKGLRHGFGVAAVSAGIPLNLVQKWLGHAQLTTTAIYANAVGAEEKTIAQRMWT